MKEKKKEKKLNVSNFLNDKSKTVITAVIDMIYKN